MSNSSQGLPGAAPAAGSAAPAVPGAVPGQQALNPHQQIFQANIALYQQLAQTKQLTQEAFQRNPGLLMVHNAFQQNMLQQQQAMANAAAQRPPLHPSSALPSLPTTAATVSVGPPAPAAPPPTSAGASGGGTISRKRKADGTHAHHTLPDKPWEIIPESPLFVALQDAERRIDAAINRKMAALTELAASAKRVVEGRAVGDTPGSARKRLRIYIFSRHHNQAQKKSSAGGNGGGGDEEAAPSNGAAGAAKAPAEPPSWSLHINGRVLDPDACHPGGGGDPEPPEDAKTMRHRFTHYLRRLEVWLDEDEDEEDEEGPVAMDQCEPRVRGHRGALVWYKDQMDHEARNSFEVRRPGSRPVSATITIEMDHQPTLFVAPPALEALVGLQTGEGGAPGLYSSNYVASKVYAYARLHGLLTNTPDGPAVRPTVPLLTALGIPTAEAEALAAAGIPTKVDEVKDMVKEAMSPPQPLVVSHSITVDGPATSPITCLDMHLEVPMDFDAGARDIAAVVAAGQKLDKEVEALDAALGHYWHRFKDHKRRHALLAAFSVDPVGVIREIIAAQGRELRMAVGKEGQATEVMRSADVYGDTWTQDAILKYLTKKAAAAAAPVAVAPMAVAAAVGGTMMTQTVTQEQMQRMQAAAAHQAQLAAAAQFQMQQQQAAAQALAAQQAGAVAPVPAAAAAPADQGPTPMQQ
jgi:SWI/SNF-related matrix-associated actin-dependent regulator of chromatin subfamily D